ncbi:4a-hydroxytetrahydrobiopterin dehydratase [Afifella sp. IM 167]|uniref:4a-hydroxytetrahydrobiopterin dehydratase n=1 Tax=Afifella sp. IM 167 TaxID=2033586 RepID=UPI001CCB0EDC|nr:4a-hydroxytetrahydrobiopterin dehydratase [Afifella sp. IM 167]MBZ8135109.1 pterin-4-alpha-carbinolamine dehydratase [Afifella sp. IM 167]
MAEECRYTNEEAASEAKASLPDWRVEEGMLTRSVKTGNFAESLLAANAIGYLAEKADHHPDLTVKWGSLDIALRSHDVDALTDRDFQLAKQIETVL